MITPVSASNGSSSTAYTGPSIRVEGDATLKQTARSTEADNQQSAVVNLSAQAAVPRPPRGAPPPGGSPPSEQQDASSSDSSSTDDTSSTTSSSLLTVPVTAYAPADVDQDGVVSEMEQHDYGLKHPELIDEDSKNQALLKTYEAVARAVS